MTLPNFLGIGVPKAGTTWLYNLLLGHPEVYLSTKIKDIRYFNRNYDKGIEWYQSYFPQVPEALQYRAIGDITVHYLYCQECPKRIARDLANPKFILMLRNPVNRTWSNYHHTARLRNYQHSFDNYLEDHYAEAIAHSRYAEHLKRYLAYFDLDQFLILIYEDVFSDIAITRHQIAEFLQIDPHGFAQNAGGEVVNKGYIPRYRTLYAMVAKASWLAENKQFHWPVNLAKKIGVKRLIALKGEKIAPMSEEEKRRLMVFFEDDITELESLIQVDLSQWRC